MLHDFMDLRFNLPNSRRVTRHFTNCELFFSMQLEERLEKRRANRRSRNTAIRQLVELLEEHRRYIAVTSPGTAEVEPPVQAIASRAQRRARMSSSSAFPADAHSINVFSPLPSITSPVVIDGTSQPGYAGRPLIELNGNNAGSQANGIDIQAGGCSILGLYIDQFNASGILLESDGNSLVEGNVLVKNTRFGLVIEDFTLAAQGTLRPRSG